MTIIEKVTELYKKLGGGDNPDAQIVCDLIWYLDYKNFEIEMLRLYGNNDCIALADEKIQLMSKLSTKL